MFIGQSCSATEIRTLVEDMIAGTRVALPKEWV